MIPNSSIPNEKGLTGMLNLLKASLLSIESYWKAVTDQDSDVKSDIQAARAAISQINKTLEEFNRASSENLVEDMSWWASLPKKNPNPILEIGLNGQIHFLNPAFQQLFPYFEVSPLAHSYLTGWEEIVKKVCGEPYAEIKRDVLVGDRYFQQTIFFIEDCRRLRIYGEDITERKQKEAELKLLLAQLEEQRKIAEIIASEAEQRASESDATFSALAEAVIVYDVNGKAKRVNPAAIKILGYDPTRDDIIGIINKISTRYADGRAIEPAETPAGRALTGETVANERFILTNAYGRQMIVLGSSSPLKKNGQIIGAVTVFNDVTNASNY
jgi:PAS domain S-box-containing protein